MKTILHLLKTNFLGQAPQWYKITVIAFLVINPLLYYLISPFVAGWAILVEFIFTLACALKCYPLQPGGLLAIEALIIGLTTPKIVFHEVELNIQTLMLLIFMVAAIYYVKDILFVVLTKLFLAIKKKHFLSLVFCLICASLSAFLDALTLVAIAIAVCFNFYAIYYRVASNSQSNEEELDEFRGFLRNIIMHGAVGTIIGGTMTLVGEPQNIMIGTKMGWSFAEFFKHNSVVSVPAAIMGFLACFSLEFFKFPGFKYQMPELARELIIKDYRKKMMEMTRQSVYLHILQAIIFVLLVFALAFHVAEVGLIGIGLIVIITALTGRIKEHDLAEAFNNAMPFAVLIVVFFAILGVVHSQHLISPLTQWVFTLSGKAQLLGLYLVNGTLSFVSDNVFIASIFISEVDAAYAVGQICEIISKIDTAHAAGTFTQFMSQHKATYSSYNNETINLFISNLEAAYSNGTLAQFITNAKLEYLGKTVIEKGWYEKLAVVVNMGTNIPALTTPNGHAALLFLLTSSLAPLIKLSYFQMIKLTLPYTVVMTTTGALAIYFFL